MTQTPITNDKALIVQFVIPGYIRRVLLSKSRLPKYYIKGKREPKTKIAAHKLSTGEYIWKKHLHQLRLFDVTTGEFVIKNTRTAGTPRYKVINGQDLYSGNTNEFVRASMMRQIKNNFLPFIHGITTPLPIDKFPIRVLAELHDTIDNDSNSQRWDVDNRMYPYNKAFMDILSKYYEDKVTGKLVAVLEKNADESKYITHRIIPDDDRIHVTQPPTALFCPIEKEEDRKLVYKIYSDIRPVTEIIKARIRKALSKIM